MDDTFTTRIAPLIAECRDLPGALLPLLHAVQHEFGYVPAEVEPAIARALSLSRAEVHGVISYYHHFRQTPPGRHVVRVCCAEACQANGAEALAAHAQVRGAVADVTVEPVYCLGLCASGPAMQVDDTTLHARVTPERFDAVMAALEAKR
jgi:formate dehydrogenase subunit gamma